jgi:hypothetical protein
VVQQQERAGIPFEINSGFFGRKWSPVGVERLVQVIPFLITHAPYTSDRDAYTVSGAVKHSAPLPCILRLPAVKKLLVVIVVDAAYAKIPLHSRRIDTCGGTGLFASLCERGFPSCLRVAACAAARP